MFQKLNNSLLTKNFSIVNHPRHGKLYGPYLYSFVENNFEKLKKNWQFNKTTFGNKVTAYYPNLSTSDGEDFKLLLDLITRSDIKNASVVFFSEQKPNVEHEQFPGVEVFWMLDELPDATLSVYPAIVNNRGKVDIGDPHLQKSLQSMLINTLEQSKGLESKIFYQKYLTNIFKELERRNVLSQQGDHQNHIRNGK